MSTAGFTYLSFSFWFRLPFCLRNGQFARLSMGRFRSGLLECCCCFCSAALVIPHNQALSREPVDPKPGTSFITQTAMENHFGIRPRSNSFASSEILLVLFYP